MKRARPLTFDLGDPADSARFDRLRPPTGAPLSATYRLQLDEIERAGTVTPERLERYRAALAPVLDAIDARHTFDAETDALMNEAERIVANAAREYLVAEGQARVDGRSKGGKGRPAPSWYAEAEQHAQTLLASGRERHELVSLCARKFKRSDDAVRRVLQEARLVERKEKPAAT